MYQDSTQLYLFGFPERVEDLIAALEIPQTIRVNSASISSSSSLVDGKGDSARDAVFVNIQSDSDIEDASTLIDRLPDSTDLIVCIPHEMIVELKPWLSKIDDIWVNPIDDDELSFRLSKWFKRHKARLDAWENSQYLETTINSIPCLVWYKTKDGIHEKVNDSFCETVAKEKDDVQGKGHAYIWNVEQDDPACIASEEIVMRTEETLVSEESIQTGDGTRLLTTYKSPLYDVDGSVMGTVGVAIDITQEREYKESLIQKNNTLESMFTALDCGIIIHSCDGSKLYGINQAALQILGYESKEEMVEDGFHMVAPTVVEEDKQMLRDKFATLVKPGDSVSTEYRVLHKDGKLVHVLGNVKLIERDGELLYQRFLLDNSKQKLKEQKRERRQQALLRALSDEYRVVCSFDLESGNGKLIRLSNSVEDDLKELFNETLDLTKTFSAYADRFIDPKDAEPFKVTLSADRLKKLLSDTNRYDIIYHRNEGTGGEFYQATIVRVGDNADDIVIGLKNVDKRIRDELQAKQLLEEALDRANRASAAKSTFLSNMSHDIRTPMNAITGFTSLASSHIDDKEKVSEYLEKIRSSSDHLLSLINDVLDMSRIESGKISLDAQAADLAEMLDNISDIMQSNIEARKQTLVVDYSEVSNLSVVCDKLKLDQILLNLLGNANKFTDEGGTIELRVKQININEDHQAKYVFTVRDNGIGMTDDFLVHIFDPFERERTSTLSGIQGTGLGMAITKNLVEMMGGSIEVESEKGVGTEFTISLTLDFADNDASSSSSDSAMSEADKHEAFRGYNILLVDDNPLNREIGATLLEDRGFTVETATNGQEVLEILKESDESRFQVILMDIQMPIMNGYETTKQVRQLENDAIANIPILALTADAFEEDKQKAIDAGMNGHVAKPIDMGQLFKTLTKILMP